MEGAAYGGLGVAGCRRKDFRERRKKLKGEANRWRGQGKDRKVDQRVNGGGGEKEEEKSKR